jgi:hypothetical protein
VYVAKWRHAASRMCCDGTRVNFVFSVLHACRRPYALPVRHSAHCGAPLSLAPSSERICRMCMAVRRGIYDVDHNCGHVGPRVRLRLPRRVPPAPTPRTTTATVTLNQSSSAGTGPGTGVPRRVGNGIQTHVELVHVSNSANSMPNARPPLSGADAGARICAYNRH